MFPIVLLANEDDSDQDTDAWLGLGKLNNFFLRVIESVRVYEDNFRERTCV